MVIMMVKQAMTPRFNNRPFCAKFGQSGIKDRTRPMYQTRMRSFNDGEVCEGRGSFLEGRDAGAARPHKNARFYT
jgi:hypothetical protein